MGVGAFVEPLVVISLLVGGTWINRSRNVSERYKAWGEHKRDDSNSTQGSRLGSFGSEEDLSNIPKPSQSPSYLSQHHKNDGWRMRNINVPGWHRHIHSPNTGVFSERIHSRALRRLPFLVECWYWALIYWVYQLGRAFTAVTIVQGTVQSARNHALRLIHLEKRLNIFWEPAIQQYFLSHPPLMHWINRTYSFIHIPGTILFLIWLYYFTITSRLESFTNGPAIYQARRRMMAMCNLIAFVIFTAWPCMPPRLLSEPLYHGEQGPEARSYGFVDTVHSAAGEGSVWTTNRFCNQYAAMPSLHFGYSLLIGLTIASMDPAYAQPWRRMRLREKLSLVMMKTVGVAYPTLILIVIIATANHFILDAVAGALVCGVAWKSERLLLNLLPLEDWFLWCLRMHKPEIEGSDVGFEDVKAVLPGILPK